MVLLSLLIKSHAIAFGWVTALLQNFDECLIVSKGLRLYETSDYQVKVQEQ